MNREEVKKKRRNDVELEKGVCPRGAAGTKEMERKKEIEREARRGMVG